jgi:hypothetical protein
MEELQAAKAWVLLWALTATFAALASMDCPERIAYVEIDCGTGGDGRGLMPAAG